MLNLSISQNSMQALYVLHFDRKKKYILYFNKALSSHPHLSPSHTSSTHW